jgi:hypothetical protein
MHIHRAFNRAVSACLKASSGSSASRRSFRGPMQKLSKFLGLSKTSCNISITPCIHTYTHTHVWRLCGKETLQRDTRE